MTAGDSPDDGDLVGTDGKIAVPDDVAEAVRTLIRWAGDDPTREGLIDTPKRVARAWKEYCAGYTDDPRQHLSRVFEEVGGYDEIVLLRDIPFQSHCEHHMAPIIGKAHIAYLPSDWVVGISKLARVAHAYARRLQVQERLTAEVANCIWEGLKPHGVAVVIEASHACMTARGVRTPGVAMVTSRMMGVFRDDERSRKEVLALMGLLMHPRTVLVTGGAKRLGAEIVRALAAAGHGVVIHYGRSSEAAEALAREIGALGTVRADLANGCEVDALIAQAREVAGRPIDGLVNSASEFTFDAPPDPDPVLLQRLYAVNCAAPVRLACALARQDGISRGSVVNLLDQKLVNPNPDFFSYSLAKFALAGAMTMLAQALGPRIAVNGVAPGITLPSGGQNKAEFHAVAARNLLRRPVDPQDVAGAVAYLIGARGLCSQTIYVDCGQRFVRSARDVMFEDADG